MRVLPWVLSAVVLPCVSVAALPDEIAVLSRPHDPYGAPRPAPGQQHVPLLTTFYVELGVGGGSSDAILPESIGMELQPEGQPAFAILRPGRQAAEGYQARFMPAKHPKNGTAIAVYVDSQRRLRPSTRYNLRVSARTRDGAVVASSPGAWQFTTEAAPTTQPLTFELSLKSPAVHWRGGFFTGFCSTGFCTSEINRLPTFQLMEQVRKTSPQAWSLKRDFWMTGMEHQPAFLSGNLPNIVRERETRRIAAIDKHPDGALLRVEDFFGHEQYGIASGRPLTEDYHPGDEVLVADGVHDARAKVIRADDRQRTVLVTAFSAPAGGWKIAYASPPNRKENPNAPGVFPPGGCYLRKFRPSGTPVYYWGRLDREWDLAHKQFRQRLLPNFADAPGDLALDGRNWTTAKDYAELHEATRAIAGHIIQRYGAATLDFPWSVFNEPDLMGFFWRSDWNELQKFYDYTVDAVLRAFEDHGYDSQRVMVGGLELGGIFGTNLRLVEFLSHCSPRAKAPGALVGNAAFADRRLDGKRSKRVESLCKAHAGRGSPCDFISVHAYNRSQLMADKLIRAKEMALQIDAEFYAGLWVNSHESCPEWNAPPDPAYHDSYLGNGYYSTWCADVARRQLQRAAQDPRYAFGESILTFWAWPCNNFEGRNDCVRAIRVDDNGDGKTDRTVTVAMPILHFLGLMARMQNVGWLSRAVQEGPGDSAAKQDGSGDPSYAKYHVLPEHAVGGHVVSGFASQVNDSLYILLYSHHALDTEARSDAQFDVTLRLADLKLVGWAERSESHQNENRGAQGKSQGKPVGLASLGPPYPIKPQQVRMEEYRFDKDHNSYFRLGRQLRDEPLQQTNDAAHFSQLQTALRQIESDVRSEQLAGLDRLAALGPAASQAGGAIFRLYEKSPDAAVREKAIGTIMRLNAPRAYPASAVRKIEELSNLRSTRTTSHQIGPDGRLDIRVKLAANGANWISIQPP